MRLYLPMRSDWNGHCILHIDQGLDCPAGARSAPAGPIGTKGPEGTFRPFGPAGVLRRRLLHRNGTFVPPAPPTRTRWRVKTDFLRKTGRSGPFFHQSGRFQGVERAKFRCRRSHLFGFSRRWPESGRFGRFSGPRGPKCSLIDSHPEGATRRPTRVHPGYPFPI